MFKKLVQALSKVPGLGWLCRLVDDVDKPQANLRKRSEPRSPELRQPGGTHRAKSAVPASRGAARSAGPARAASPGNKLAVAVGAVSPGERSPASPPGRAAPAAEFREAPGTGAKQRPGPPASPAEQRLGLAAIEPGRAFAFWKLSRQAIGRARQYLGEGNGGEQATAVVLRVHDITLVDFDGSNARRTMDLSVGEGAVGEGAAPQTTGTIKGSLYLELWTGHPDTPSPSRIYCELGVQDSAGDFVAVAWSPILDLPIMEESPRELPVRALVNGEHTAPWRPRLEPPPSVSSPFEAAASATTRHDAHTTDETSPGGTDESDRSGHQVVSVAVDLPASARWTASSPSSADLVTGRDRRRSPDGISSGLLARRKRSFK